MATSADKAVNDAQKSSLKTGKRDCPNCGLPQPIRKRVCGGCKEQFVPKPKRKQQDIGAMGKTSVTEQRRLLEKRANILHMHHNADIVILMHSRHGRGNTVTCFGTEGAGVAFIGNKQNVKQSGEGHMVEKLFTKFMQDYKMEISKKQECQPSPPLVAQGTSSNPLECQPSPPLAAQASNPLDCQPSPPLAAQGTSSNPLDCQPSPPLAAQGTSSNPLDCQPSPPLAAQGTSSNPLDCQPSPPLAAQGTSSNPLECQLSPPLVAQGTSSNPLAMLVYYPNNIAVAGGIPYPTRRSLHGHTIPAGYTCVMLTCCHEHFKAPLILGDPEENGILEKNKFFALPNDSLMQFLPNKTMIPYQPL